MKNTKLTQLQLQLQHKFKGKLPLPQRIIVVFLIVMFLMSVYLKMPIGSIVSDSLVRLVMNGVLVLSLVPMLNAGVGINYGLPVGVSAGLIGMCIAVNLNFIGLFGFGMSMLLSIPFGIAFGYGYSFVLNKVKGKEEITATFIGFSFVFFMCFFWAVAPFKNGEMLWPIGGKGMRPTIGLKNYFGKALNELFLIQIGSVKIPLGMLLFFALLCLLLFLFFKTKIGAAIQAVGENETYAMLCGVEIKKTKIIAIILSTVIAAIGICVYAQSYGFIELYDAPLMVAFPAASAVLIGGTGGRKTSIFQVVIGTYLFQSIYLLSAPLANELLVPEAAEIFRMMITNFTILYALLYEGRKNKYEKG
jgi:simple sugar transport system permease protein